MLKNKFYFGLALLWTAVVLFLSLISIGSIGSEVAIPNKDKIVHFIFYFVFVILWSKAIRTAKFKIMLIAVLFGIGMEFLQQFTPSRTPDAVDILANTLGAITATIFFKITQKPFI